jgi:hypothetical protein
VRRRGGAYIKFGDGTVTAPLSDILVQLNMAEISSAIDKVVGIYLDTHRRAAAPDRPPLSAVESAA